MLKTFGLFFRKKKMHRKSQTSAKGFDWPFGTRKQWGMLMNLILCLSCRLHIRQLNETLMNYLLIHTPFYNWIPVPIHISSFNQPHCLKRQTNKPNSETPICVFDYVLILNNVFIFIYSNSQEALLSAHMRFSHLYGRLCGNGNQG